MIINIDEFNCHFYHVLRWVPCPQEYLWWNERIELRWLFLSLTEWLKENGPMSANTYQRQ